MADNVTITAGSGTSIGTDDVGGIHYQRMKLVTAEDGASEPIGDTDHGTQRSLWVDPRPKVGVQSQDSSGLTTATTSYAAGDVLGAGWTFTNMARATGGTGRITAASVLDDGDVMGGIDLYLASGSITFGTDNATPSVSDADAAKLHGIIGLPFVDLGSSRFASAHGLSVPYVCDATSLFVYARTIDAHNFFAAVDDLHLRLFYEMD